MNIDNSADLMGQKCEEYIKDGKSNVKAGQHSLARCPHCDGLQYTAVFQFKFAMRPGPIKTHFPDAMLTPLINSDQSEIKRKARSGSLCPLKRKACRDQSAGEVTVDDTRATASATEGPQGQPMVMADTGVGTTTQEQTAVNNRTSTAASKAALEQSMIEMKADVERARAEGKAEAERARAATEEMAQRMAKLEAEAESARAEGKAEAERARAANEEMAQSMAKMTRSYAKLKEECELRAKYRQDDIDKLFIRMDRAHIDLKAEIDLARTEGKENTETAKRGLTEKIRDLESMSNLMQGQVAILGESVIGGGIARLARIVLDNINDNFFSVPGFKPPPEGIEMGELKASGVFMVRQCESLLLETQPMIKNADMRAREVFRYLTQGRYLSPGGEWGNADGADIFIEEGAVLISCHRDKRPIKWEREPTGRWKMVDWK